MDRYIGLDAHASSCTLGVVTPKGKRVGSHVVETNARCLIEAVRQIPRAAPHLPGGGHAVGVALRGALAPRPEGGGGGGERESGVEGRPIFKGAATTVTGRREDEPIYRHYLRLLDGGTKPNLAKLTIARQIASIVLAVWRAGEVYDPERLAGASRSD